MLVFNIGAYIKAEGFREYQKNKLWVDLLHNMKVDEYIEPLQICMVRGIPINANWCVTIDDNVGGIKC